ncbi:MAG TPA: metallophosphoesterase family protein [Vicinamibacterales bacterium]|nr:metallophosphoesterase family protein [Vicinamibacterales bacterium]
MLVGLIADTHSLIRPAALSALAGSEVILHAGDVGGPSVLAALEQIAPVHAVIGNTDPEDGALPERLRLELGGLTVHVSHGHELGSPTPEKLLARYSADVIVYGHTHRPLIRQEGKRLVINPGAAGPRRFNLQPSVALLRIEQGAAAAEILPLA